MASGTRMDLSGVLQAMSIGMNRLGPLALSLALAACSQSTSEPTTAQAANVAAATPAVVPETGGRVLDFMVMADHAVGLGLATRIADKDPSIMKFPIAQRISDIAYRIFSKGRAAAH